MTCKLSVVGSEQAHGAEQLRAAALLMKRAQNDMKLFRANTQ